MSKLADLTGQKFGRLTVIERAEIIGDKTRWKCQCDCGNEIIVYATNLKRGLTKSCGCYEKDFPSHYKHGHGKHGDKLYGIWSGIKRRCFVSDNPAYKNYGGRGIAVCDEWLHDFKAFYDWSMNNGYQEGLTIDRIDNNKGYSPDNCRWVDMKTQANNRRNNHLLTCNGKTQTLAQWAKEYGIKYSTIQTMIHRDNRTIGEILNNI